MNAKGRRRINGTLERTREAVRRLKEAGFSQAEISRELEITKSTVAYHFRNLGSDPDRRFSKRYDWEAIQEDYDSGLTVRQCAAKYGFSMCTWHKAILRGDVTARPRAMPIEVLLVDDRPQTNRSHLKQRLLSEGLKENRCEQCGIAEWRGGLLNMEIHHINGKGKDNRVENLMFLCPNCHSQTDNWGGRAVKLNGSRSHPAR
ncbi:MAG TPA: HNH endonuclease [Solirubrobacterales bacterium]|nr:HNH endonuclease [Solirubrobacterales bacterium]